jgi:hypothetical protein
MSFSSTALALISGNVICSITDDTSFNHLSDPILFKEMGEYVSKINRCLKSDDSASIFYLVYVDSTVNDNESTLKMFTEMRNTVEPLVNLLYAFMDLQNHDYAISAGMRIELYTLESALRNRPDLMAGLKKVYRKINPTGRLKKDITGRDLLAKLMRTFCKQNLFVLKGEDVYLVTGKINLYYEYLEYIKENESIEDAVVV